MTFSLWLEFASLRPVVDELAAEVGNAAFQPHMTLAGGLRRRPDAATFGGIPLPLVRLTGFGTKSERTRYFCLVAARSPQLDALFADVATSLTDADVSRFRDWPHVSLVYGTDAAQQKWPDPMTLAHRFADSLFTTYQPDALSLWRTDGGVAEWQRVQTFATSATETETA